MLTGLTARTGLLRVGERPLTSTEVPFPKRAPLPMLLLLTDKDLHRPWSREVLPAVCRSVWDLTLRDILARDMEDAREPTEDADVEKEVASFWGLDG